MRFLGAHINVCRTLKIQPRSWFPSSGDGLIDIDELTRFVANAQVHCMALHCHNRDHALLCQGIPKSSQMTSLMRGAGVVTAVL